MEFNLLWLQINFHGKISLRHPMGGYYGTQ